MQIYITCFSNIRYFKENMIPVSTALGWPWWIYKDTGYQTGSYFVNKNNVMLGISDDRLHFNKDSFESLEEKCSKDCLYKDKVPNCQFMLSYYNHLKTINFKEVINDLKDTGEAVRQITHFQGEPIFILLVYESSKCNCAERPCLQRWFKDNNYELKEWYRD